MHTNKRLNPYLCFWNKVETPLNPNECWMWKGRKQKKGYGVYSWNQNKWPEVHDNSQLAHKAAWEQFNGRVPRGMYMDHLCRNHACVNPRHLEVVTPKENALRGISFAAINSRKTRCVHGHPYTGRNVMLQGSGRGRRCRTCHNASSHRNRGSRGGH